MNEVDNNLLAQLIGVIALIVGISAYLSVHDRKLKILLAFQGLFLSLHFWLLGAEVGSLVALITGLRNGLAAMFPLKKFSSVFIVFYLVLGVTRYSTWVDALPTVAACLGTYAIFHLEGIRMRVCAQGGTVLWIVHNAYMHSVGPFFMEVLMLCASIRTIMKLRR